MRMHFFNLKFKVAISSILIFIAVSYVNAQSITRERILFNSDWKFIKDDPTDIVTIDDKGKVIKSELDYSVVKD